jgi:hypothetical protein
MENPPNGGLMGKYGKIIYQWGIGFSLPRLITGG